MKCSGKRLVKYLKILNRNSRGEVSLPRFFKAEHREAVASGYIQQVVQYADPNNDQRYKICNQVWALTSDGSTFLRQLRGDFKPPALDAIESIDLFSNSIESIDLFSNSINRALRIPPDMLVKGTTTGRWYSGDGNIRGRSCLTPKVLNDAKQVISDRRLLRK